MDDPLYLGSLVRLIAEPPSLHSLLDAYATFVNRVRSQCHILDVCHASELPAIDPVQTHSSVLVLALRRDVRLAHVRLDSEQHAKEASSLCHHALCALATIFRFPALHSAFLEHDLSVLFGDVLGIALADQLPVFSEAKTYSLSLWTLRSHRLPLSVLVSRRDDLLPALQRCLDGASQPHAIVLDALNTISHTIDRHPSDLLFPLLPHVITTLVCKSPDLRLHASIALGKFAIALVHQTNLSPTMWQSLSDHVMSFLDSQSRLTPSDTSFSGMLRDAFSAGSHTPPRILAVLAAFILLCGPSLYTKPLVLHFVLQSLGVALTHKRSIVRALHPHVWRCFVWTFSQMLLSAEKMEQASIASAFYVIKQEVTGGIGIALASVLLSDRISAIRSGGRASRVSQALSVIGSMVHTECKHTRREGFVFLQAIANNAQARHQIVENAYEFPASVLLNGAIARAEWNNLASIIHSIPKVPISVHWPERTEIAQHYEALLVTWKLFASREDRNELDSLIDVWQSILLACSLQLECSQHITETTNVLRHAAVTIVEFLPPVTSVDCQPDWGSWNVHDQLRTLTFVDKLWSVMRKAFVTFRLAEAAELILTSILKYAFHVLDSGVRTLWSSLCANLMITAPPSFLRDMHDPSTSQLVICGQRELWGVVATSLSASELSLDWKELVAFLAIPICTWVLSEPELEGWEALLSNAITASGDPARTMQHVVSEHFLRKDIETWDSVMVVLGFLLTRVQECGEYSLTDELLSTVEVCLTAFYRRARHSPEALSQSLKLLAVIRRVIASNPGSVMHIVRPLSSSLCLWIEDHAEVMSDDEFNSVAVSLYCEVLKALEVLPLSIQSLHDSEEFLASAFSRIPTPAVAPFAFEKFWKATYHGRSEFCNILPSKIKSCLVCFVTAYGGDLANGLSSTTGSQSQSISNNSSIRSPTSLQHRDTGESGFSPRSTSLSAGARIETFLTHGDDDDALQSVALRQLQEYSSRLESSLDDSKHLISSSMVPKSHSFDKLLSGTSHLPNQKRKLAEIDAVPQKRSRISRNTRYSARKLESEPATRDLTPVNIPRMNSVPLKERVAQSAEENGNVTFDTRQGSAAVQQTPSSLRARRGNGTAAYSFDESDEDDIDWENLHVDVTSSEADVDRSLENVFPSSPPQTSTPHDKAPCLASGSSPPKAVSQSERSPPASVRLRAKTASTGLDALQDVYSSVLNGASQIPLSQLFQATKLVHQIGAALTEQMGKKMSKRG